MSTFDEREKGFEAKYGHDEEIRFKVAARRNKLLGLWVAEQLGLKGAAAEQYAKAVVEVEFQTGDSHLVEKVLADCAAKGVAMTERRLRKQMAEFAKLARNQIVGKST